jgi:uncharacterized RDD family membrane protein YckC
MMPMRNISAFTPQGSQQTIDLEVHVMGRRVAAALLDFIPLGILIVLVDSTFGIDRHLSSLSSLLGIPYTSGNTVAWPWLYLVMMTYYVVQETLFSTTIGKFLMGLRVVQDDGSPITFKNAFVRNIVRPVDAIWGCLLGWILTLCSSRRRRLGDHLARTLVVSVDSAPIFSLRRSYPWQRLRILALLCAFFIAFCLGFDYYGRPPLVIQSLTYANAPSPIFTDRGTITNLTLSHLTRKDNTVTYAVTFYAHGHGTMSNCKGDITLMWSGFFGGWQVGSGDTTCNPMASPLR